MREITKRISGYYQDYTKGRQDAAASNRSCPRRLCEEARGLLYEGLRPSSNSKKYNHASSVLYIALDMLFFGLCEN